MVSYNFIASIIIPNRNRTNDLINLISTIPAREDIEIIIIDDLSDVEVNYDYIKTLHNNVIVDFLKPKRSSKYTRIYDGLGAGAARNLGITLSCGQWLFFFDSDDYVDKDALDNLLSDLYDLVDKDVIYYMAKTANLVEKRNRHQFLLNAFDSYNISGCVSSLRFYNPVPWSKAVKKDLIIKYNISFDEILASNDSLFSLKIGFYSVNIHVSNDVIYYVTNSNNSLTSDFNECKSFSRLISLVNTVSFCDDNNIDRNVPYGFTYFLQSKPHKLSLLKLRYYYKYFKILLLKFL